MGGGRREMSEEGRERKERERPCPFRTPVLWQTSHRWCSGPSDCEQWNVNKSQNSKEGRKGVRTQAWSSSGNKGIADSPDTSPPQTLSPQRRRCTWEWRGREREWVSERERERETDLKVGEVHSNWRTFFVRVYEYFYFNYLLIIYIIQKNIYHFNKFWD